MTLSGKVLQRERLAVGLAQRQRLEALSDWSKSPTARMFLAMGAAGWSF